MPPLAGALLQLTTCTAVVRMQCLWRFHSLGGLKPGNTSCMLSRCSSCSSQARASSIRLGKRFFRSAMPALCSVPLSAPGHLSLQRTAAYTRHVTCHVPPPLTAAPAASCMGSEAAALLLGATQVAAVGCCASALPPAGVLL